MTDQEMMRQAQLAGARAVGLEAVRMQCALKSHELLLANLCDNGEVLPGASKPVLDQIAVEAVSAADSLMAALARRS